MTPINLNAIASDLSASWRSVILGQPGLSNFKVLRMDNSSYPAETHPFCEALLVISGCMMLDIDGAVTEVKAGEVFFVAAGKPHAVAKGSQGTLVIIDLPDA